MDQRVSLITLGIRDLAKSRSFYEKLGWKAAACSNEHIAFFQLHSQVLGLYPLDHLLADQDKSAIQPVPGGITLGINVASKQQVDDYMQAVIDAGGRLIKAAAETPWGGYTGYVADLDDHPWEFSWVPVFPLGENGELVIES